MSRCGLSSTGLNNIDANELTSDNITVFSNLNVSGHSFLNNVLIDNNTTLSSSSNVSGFTTFKNKTTLLSPLHVSGVTTLDPAHGLPWLPAEVGGRSPHPYPGDYRCRGRDYRGSPLGSAETTG